MLFQQAHLPLWVCDCHVHRNNTDEWNTLLICKRKLLFVHAACSYQIHNIHHNTFHDSEVISFSHHYEETCITCHCVCGLFCLRQCPQNPSTLLQVSGFDFFLVAESTPLKVGVTHFHLCICSWVCSLTMYLRNYE